MKKKTLAAAFISILLLLAVAAISFANLACAQTFETVTIKADGSIDPQTAPITQTGNVYTLTGDILGCITVEKLNIIIDGAGYTIQGNGTGRGIQIANPHDATIKSSYDVTVKNINIKGFNEAIDVFGYWGNLINGVVVAGNNITNNNVGIRFSSYSRYSNNTIIGNNISFNIHGITMEMGHEGDASGNNVTENRVANNQVGMWFLWLGDYYGPKPDPFPMNNRIYRNNFFSNGQNVVNAHVIYDPDCANIWDYGSVGNYWSSYSGRDVNDDGIGDTPYIIDANNQDNFPLMAPVEIIIELPRPNPSPLQSPIPSQEPASTPEPQQSEPFSTAYSMGIVAVIVLVLLGSIVYILKHK